MSAIVLVQELVKTYGNVLAVDGISFAIEEGEIFSLLGPNGAGKTTTISILSTLFPPTRGEAWIGGFSITREPMQVRRMIGVIPQEIALYEDLNARENLLFWGQMVGLEGKVLKQRVDEILERVGLVEKARQPVKTYSGGMKRRLNIGVGLLHAPRLLFMDEPTVGIDPQSRRAILDMVKDLNRSGVTILYTTHYMEEAQELSHRIGIIDHGKMIAIGTLSELIRQIGEQEKIILSFSEDQHLAPLVDDLNALAGVNHVIAENHSVTLIVDKAEEILPEVMQWGHQRGLKIRSLQIEEPDLEAVFLHLTGRALRD
ncbi:MULTISPECIES: ATP-binding cassette domain-containing protein [Anaerolinea]|uniref:ATP-binding cassette domain-containing protein n=1 Tax=Anaerolinea TaxID=233189 RepID=UPI00261E2630|nr:ATP-binding cassette domain-containing protein [Anaerolinea thermophila]